MLTTEQTDRLRQLREQHMAEARERFADGLTLDDTDGAKLTPVGEVPEDLRDDLRLAMLLATKSAEYEEQCHQGGDDNCDTCESLQEDAEIAGDSFLTAVMERLQIDLGDDHVIHNGFQIFHVEESAA